MHFLIDVLFKCESGSKCVHKKADRVGPSDARKKGWMGANGGESVFARHLSGFLRESTMLQQFVWIHWSKIQGNNVAWHLDHRNKLACLIQSWRWACRLLGLIPVLMKNNNDQKMKVINVSLFCIGGCFCRSNVPMCTWKSRLMHSLSLVQKVYWRVLEKQYTSQIFLLYKIKAIPSA